MLVAAVLARCDANDGIHDGVIDDPTSCDFNPDQDLEPLMCRDDVNGDGCFTTPQIALIKELYAGSSDSKGTPVYPGKTHGSEPEWLDELFPYPGNEFTPGAFGIAGNHLNYIFYETDPGIELPDLTDRRREGAGHLSDERQGVSSSGSRRASWMPRRWRQRSMSI